MIAFLLETAALVLVSALPAESQGGALAEGQELLKLGRYSEAELAFERATAEDPRSARSQYFLGVARMRLGRPEDAVAPLETSRSLSARPNPAVLFELGTAYLQTERFDDAIEALSQGSSIAPDDPVMRLELGFAYYKRLDGEKARAEFLSVLEKQPNAPQAHFYLGLAEAALGRLDEAQRAFRRTLELAPAFVDARLGLARTLSQAGRDDEAAAELGEIVESHLPGTPPVVSAHNELGLIALRARNPERARQEFEAVVAARPGDRQATYNLWLLYKRMGREEDAEEMRKRFEASKDEATPMQSAATRSKKKSR